MVYLLENIFRVVWHEEVVPKEWKEGLIVKKGDKEEPGNYRGTMLLGIVGKVFCKILNNRLVKYLDRERALHEGRALEVV